MAQQVSTAELDTVLEWLAKDLPDTSRPYGLTISNIRGLEKDEFWVDRWPDFTTVLIKTTQKPGVQLKDFPNSMTAHTTDGEACYSLLSLDSVLDLSGKFVFHGITTLTKQVLERICKEKNVKIKLEHCGLAEYSLVRRGGIRNITLPEGFILGPLRVEDAELVSSKWTYADEHAAEFLAYCIQSYPSAGIRSPDGKLVAWAITNRDWSIGSLFVEPDYRRRGLAQAVYQRIVKGIMDQGVSAYARVTLGNISSFNFHRKCGFDFVRKEGIYYLMDFGNAAVDN